MDIEQEYKDYLDYVSDYYPKSLLNFSDNVNYNILIKNSLKSINLLDLYYNYQNTEINTRKLIEELKMYFVRFLYVLPLNDYFIIDSVLRALSENLLRIVYDIIYSGKRIEEIKKLSYRNLWENGIKKWGEFNQFNTSLSNVNNIFRKKSDTLHSSKVRYENQIDYMIELMIEDNQVFLKQLESDMRLLYKFILIQLKCFLKIDEQDLTVQQIRVFKMVRQS